MSRDAAVPQRSKGLRATSSRGIKKQDLPGGVRDAIFTYHLQFLTEVC